MKKKICWSLLDPYSLVTVRVRKRREAWGCLLDSMYFRMLIAWLPVPD